VSYNFLGKAPGWSDTKYFSPLGGLGINLLNTSKILSKNGYDVTILQHDSGAEISSYDDINIAYVPVKTSDSILFNTMNFNLKWHKYVPKDVDVVHLQYYMYGLPYNKLILSSNHPGIEWDHPIRLRPFGVNYLVKRTFHSLLKKGVLFRASDNSVLSYVQANMPKYRNQVIPVPNGVDEKKFRPKQVQRSELGIDDDRPIIFFPRSITQKHGSFLLLESIAKLKEISTDFIVVMAGPLKLNEKRIFFNRINNLKLKDHIILKGHISYSEMVDYYNVADIVTIPSLCSEGTTISCLEAMACEKPVVVTNVGGIKELIYRSYIDGGIIVQADIFQLRNAFLKLLNNPESRKELGKRGRKRVKKYFTLEHYEKGIVNYFSYVTRKKNIL
jgi:glycosyltransferase involved in cell wall biosynthesis